MDNNHTGSVGSTLKDYFKKFRWPLFIVILIFLSGYLGFYITTSTAFPQNPSTETYFNK